MRKILKLTAVLLIISAAVLCLSVPTFATQTPSPAAGQSYRTMEDAVSQLREGLESRQSPITVQFYSAEPESEEMAQTVFYSAIAHTGVPTEGDYIYRHISNLKFNCETEALDDGYLSTITYTVTYRTTAAQEAEVSEKVAEILDALDVYNATDYEKVLAIYNYLCSHVTAPALVGTADYTAYGALIKESAVCQGFSSAFYRLALELGVDNRLLSGKIGNVKHGWNIVAMEGLYYHVDATKDAGFSPEQYHCFLKADLPDHVRDSTYDTEEFHGNYPMGEKDYEPHKHTWNAGDVTKTPTCKETGVKTYTCTAEDCDETKTEELPKLTVHTWDEGIVTKEATGYEEGVKTYTCAVCSETREESLPKNGWELAEGNWYYHVEGALATGWVSYKDRWYYLQPDGVMTANNWVLWKEKWYYLDKDGIMVENNWVLWKDRWYYLEQGGPMMAGNWVLWKNKWYYLDENGIMVENNWVLWKDRWYYLQQGGPMAENCWVLWKDKWYFLDTGGAMKTGWLKWKDNWYYLKADGVMATDSVTIGSVTFRFLPNGVWYL